MADGFAERVRKTRCCCSCCQSPGFDQEDLAFDGRTTSKLADQRQRNPGGFSSSWRSLQDHGGPWTEQGLQLRQQGIDGKGTRQGQLPLAEEFEHSEQKKTAEGPHGSEQAHKRRESEAECGHEENLKGRSDSVLGRRVLEG